MAEVKLVYCGTPRWSPRPDSKNISYVYANDRGEEVEIVEWREPPPQQHPSVVLYPVGISPFGQVRNGRSGYVVCGLLAAQAEAIKILSHD